MTFIYDHQTPSVSLMEDILRKVNALGHEPRVVIELDKLSYVPGMKSRFDVVDRIRHSTLEILKPSISINAPLGAEPSGMTPGGESGERFEYIKCAFSKKVKEFSLPKQAYYFMLAIAKHETGFGTLGQGRPEKGSFIVGYGCPNKCDFTYSGIETQAHWACKRYADAMKSKYNGINARGYMDESDIDYFHQGGDKGYNKWVWSADGANWKSKVKNYYDAIRTENAHKWNCGTDALGLISKHSQTSVKDDCGCDKEEVYTVQEQKMGINANSSPSSIVFPIESINLQNGAKVSSHHMKHKGGRRNHKGIDLVHTTQGKVNGMWVVAAYGGFVTKAYKSPSYGNCVMIQHENGYMTVYAHMQDDSLQVRAGQYVHAGTRLGKVGNTGNSYGAHLHFELWKGKWVYGGNNHIDPYPVLTGEQKIGIVSGDTVGGPVQIIPNVKFNKCFDKDATLDGNWIDRSNLKHFTSVKTAEKYLGFSGNVPKGSVAGFGYKHRFSTDGYFEYSFYADLGEGDSVTVAYDGEIVKTYTNKDNTTHPTFEPPIHGKFHLDGQAGINSHILSFTFENVSGKGEFGLKCFKVTEVEATYGTDVSEEYTTRKRDVWLETGAFVYDTTFTIEDDIKQWEVNHHFDMRVATARFTLNNQYGIYSPHYERTTIFPDNLKESEMSYYEGGSIQHVLSEATPVRIYAGYGDNLVRVFTGRIKGEIEQDSEERTITVNCVDMYNTLEEHVFDRELTFPRRDEIHGDEATPLTAWVKSAIVHNIVNESGLIGWRLHEDDIQYPDAIIEETYYIDIDRGGKRAVIWDAKSQQYMEKSIDTVQDPHGYKNPYVQAIDFEEGTRASDAIEEIIGDIMYRAYCDRYGTFRLENIRNLAVSNDKWEFIDGENLQSLTSSIDHSRVRNHLIIEGNRGQVEHFLDQELYIALKGNIRTAKIVADWIDESNGASARGVKEDVVNKLFFDMKRQARNFNVVVKGNPMIDVLDGCYIYDKSTSSAGYFIVKGNRLVGSKEGMVNFLELTWEDTVTHKVTS